MKSILDSSFRYTTSFDTDVRKTFARIRRDQQKDSRNALQAAENALAKVTPLVRRTVTG